MNKLFTYLFVGCNLAFAKAELVQKPVPQEFKGFYNFIYDDSKGTITLEVEKLDQEFLYVHSLATGIGSNDIGIDRGQLGDGVVVKWVKAGNKLLLVQGNLGYRASSNNMQEKASVEQAFARSVLYGFSIKETKGTTYTIDLTPFLMEDSHGIVERLKSQKEGTYKIDASRSALWMERTKSFPKNTEFETLLTYTGTPTGRNLRSVVPDPSAITVIQHISFVELPEAGFEPRAFDPRSGSFYTEYLDYSASVQDPIVKKLINRHRLEKVNPTAAVSEVKKPIIYYLDNGTPEPIRSALLDGARWWADAFLAAGFKDAYKVEILPADADPMDLRYNVIQWVHRSTRGWSYGASITDPRTGEILKGHVSLGSLRIRQDFKIAQGFLKEPFKDSDDNNDPMLQMALARIRQLSAHEVGHTLGFAHNYAASAVENSSVMDYPHPYIQLKNGTIDLSQAYSTGIGAWDKVAAIYSYSTVPSGVSEKEHLKTILENAYSKDLRYITDYDARSTSGSHATAHLWDNGANAATELNRVMDVRQVAIKQFSIHNIRNGEPLSVLEDVFVPVYYSHRYQVEAASKLIGGLEYDYSIKGDGTTFRHVSREQQENALSALTRTLKATELVLPEYILKLFPPRAYGYGVDRESFKSNVGLSFDAETAALTAADFTFQFLLKTERLNRVSQYHALDNEHLSVTDLYEKIEREITPNKNLNAYEHLLQTTVYSRFIAYLLNTINTADVSNSVTIETFKYVNSLITKHKRNKMDYAVHALRQITNFKENKKLYIFPKIDNLPDGSPIGN